MFRGHVALSPYLAATCNVSRTRISLEKDRQNASALSYAPLLLRVYVHVRRFFVDILTVMLVY